MTRTLLVPGLEASPAPHWQHWWAMTDPRAITVDLSEPAEPDPMIWEAELAGLILQHPDSVLVGHSLGAVLISRILAKWPQLRVRAAMLVAPAEPEGKSRIGRFAPLAELPLTVPTMLVASRNDPWMRFERAQDLARNWQADLIDLGHSGHINAAAGFGPWPQGKALRDELLARSAYRVAALDGGRGKASRSEFGRPEATRTESARSETARAELVRRELGPFERGPQESGPPELGLREVGARKEKRHAQALPVVPV